MSASTPPRVEPRRTSPAALTCAVTACALGFAAVSVWCLDVGMSIVLMSETDPVFVEAPRALGWDAWLWFVWRVVLCLAIVVSAVVSARAALASQDRRGVVTGVTSVLLSVVPIVLQFGTGLSLG